MDPSLSQCNPTMSSQNNEEVFFLDDIGSPPAAPPRGLTSSPVPASSTTPTETANSSRGSSPTASPHRSVVDMPNIGPGHNIPVLQQPTQSPLLGPPIAPIAKPTTGSSSLLGSSPLLHKRPIHATPSAPSPLARASIVPHFSDCDSSSNDSAIMSDEEEEGEDTTGRGMNFGDSSGAASAFAHREKFSLGSPRNQTLAERTAAERVGTGSYGGMMTPGSLLRGKRSDSGSSQSQASSSSGGVTFPSQRDHAISMAYAPLYGGSPLSNQSYPRQRSESFGSCMDPLMASGLGGGSRKRSDSIGSMAGRPGSMLTGGTGSGSTLGFSAAIPERQRPLDKGKEREVWPADTGLSGSLGTSAGTSLSLSPKASPRRERASIRASSSLTGDRYASGRALAHNPVFITYLSF